MPKWTGNPPASKGGLSLAGFGENMSINDKKYTLTLEFDRVSALACVASLYQLFKVDIIGEDVDFCDVEDLPKSLHFLLDYVNDVLVKNSFVSWDEEEDWKALVIRLENLTHEIQSQLTLLAQPTR